MENDKITVLYLDDEVQNLLSFKASFRRHFNVHCVASVREALHILDQQKVHVFFIEQRLKETMGTEFLKLISEAFPDVINILVSGSLDDEAFLKEVASRGEIFRYIKKPWIESEIRGAIEDGYKVHCFIVEKKKELDDIKSVLSNSVKAPIANLEGLISLARVEMDDTFALRSYLEYMTLSIEALKKKLELLQDLEVK